MKKRWVIVWSVLLILVMVSGTAMMTEAADTVKVGVPFLPYQNGSAFNVRINPDSQEMEGYCVDIFREIEKADESLRFEFVPVQIEQPDRMADAALEAGCDILMGAPFIGAVNMGQYELFGQNYPYMFSRWAYVTDDPDASASLTLSDLADHKVAVMDVTADAIISYAGETPVTWERIPPEEVPLIMENVSKGEYGALVPVDSLNPYRYDISSFGISSVKELDENMSGSIPWAFLKDKKELAEKIGSDLRQLMMYGELTEISESYFGMDVSRPTSDPETTEFFWTNIDSMY